MVRKEKFSKEITEILDFNQAASLLKISHPTLYRWLGEGKIKGIKAGKQWRFYPEDIKNFIHEDESEDNEFNELINFFKDRVKCRINLPDYKLKFDDKIKEALYLIFIDAFFMKVKYIHLKTVNNEKWFLDYRINGDLIHIKELSSRVMGFIEDGIRRMFAIDNHTSGGKFIFTELFFEVSALLFHTLNSKKYTFNLSAMQEYSDIKKDVYNREDFETVENLMNIKKGLLLFAGPAGSGKSSLIYSLLKKKINDNLNVITLEEEPKYMADGFTQIRIDNSLDYSRALSLVRQADGDIIMVDRIKDMDMAEGLLSLSDNSLVITELNARNSSNAIQKIFDTGIEPYSFISSLIAVITLRAFRKVCPLCAMDYIPGEVILRAFLPGNEKIPLLKASGCSECSYTGYNNSIILYEIFMVDPLIKDMFLSGYNLRDIRQKAIESGMKTFYNQAIDLLAGKVTTFDEFVRIMGSENIASQVY